MKKLIALSALSMIVLLTGCVVPQDPSILGAIVTKNKKTIFVQNNVTNFDYTKKGSAETGGVVGLGGVLGSEDCTIATAAKNGKLTNVKFAEQEFFSIFMVYTKVTTTAYGD